MKLLNDATLYPWHQKNWELVTRVYAKTMTTGSILFWGLKGLGQYFFAERFSKWLLCEMREEQGACGQCASCQWLSAGTHPDRFIVSPESETSSIKVDAIREIRAFSEQKSHGGKHRIILISPTEAMNISAANALLKILEEPFENSIFLLVSYHFSWVLPTILSRCQKVYFPPLNQENFEKAMIAQQCSSEIIPDLYPLSYGAPLAFETSKQQQNIILAKNRLFTLMDAVFYRKTSYSIELAETMKIIEKETNVSFQNLLDILLNYLHQSIVNQKVDDKKRCYLFYDKLIQIKQNLKAGINLNQTIWLEEAFLVFS